MTNLQLAVQFFFQIAVILAICQLVGVLAKRAGQPQVVAEMIAGVLLGPSLFGLFCPELFKRLFPADSMKVLFPVSQLGLAVYMFVVGLEFRMDIVRKRLHSAIAVSLAGMLAPFVLGATLGWFFYRHTSLFPQKTSLLEAMIFLGAAMCITAFPMLARIIHFKKLAGTTMGTVALGAGAIDDASAWCLLAVVLASFDGAFQHAVMNIVGGMAYVLLTLLVIRPLLAKWARGIEERGELADREFVVCLILLALGAWITDAIGLHAVFGAFVMGTAMPRGLVTRSLIEKVQPLTVALLLPLFFTYSGLNTQIGLLDSGYLWLMTALVLAAAISGKGIACWLAARSTGVANREALGIGILMNARGLMELIIINIGLQRGIISPALFATLVIMAVITTLMASPLFELLVGKHRPANEPEERVPNMIKAEVPAR
jgi:Kef-type K+ transport system membrane component KefB